jgi:hypothetical protein
MTSTDISRVKGRYEGLQTYLKSILSDLNTYVSPESDCERDKLLGLKNSVVTIVEQLGTVHTEILNLIELKDIAPEVVEHMRSLEPVHRILATAELVLEKLTQGFDHMTMSNMSSFNNSVDQSTSQSVRCRLPKMQMPEFDGDPLAWQGFWDRYQVSIHNNARISEIDKFNYLKGCLKGEALAVISSLMLNSDNYKEAIQLLTSRFGNEQLLISCHMGSLLKISKIRSRESTRELRMLYD